MFVGLLTYLPIHLFTTSYMADIFRTIFLLPKMSISFGNFSHLAMLILNMYWHPNTCSHSFQDKHVKICLDINYIREKFLSLNFYNIQSIQIWKKYIWDTLIRYIVFSDLKENALMLWDPKQNEEWLCCETESFPKWYCP